MAEQSIEKILLSASTNGKQIKVAATATAGTTIHTAVSGTTSFDEIYLYAYNSNTDVVTLTIEFGGTTSPDNTIKIDIPAQSGRRLIADGMLLQNSLVIKVFASVADVILIDGYVHRITPS